MNFKAVPSNITKAGLYLFAFSLPVSHVPAQFGIGVAFLGWMGEGIVQNRWQLRWHPFFIPLTFYLTWNLFSAALSARPAHSLGAVLDNEWPLVVMLMMFWTIRNAVLLKRLVSALLIASFVAMVYAIWQTFGGLELYRHLQLDPMGSGYFRAVGFYGFYLTFAAFAMTIFFLSAALAVEVKSGRRWPYVITALVSFLAVVGTFARSIWLSFGTAIPLYAFTRGRKTGIAVSIALVVIVVAGFLTVPALRYRVESITDLGQNETRLNLWRTAFAISNDHPILGIGEDNWDHFFERYRVDGYYDTVVHPHNDYFSVLVSSGYPGLLAFVGMWCVALVAGYKVSRTTKDDARRAIALGSTFSLLGFLVGSFFQNYYGTFVNCLGWWLVVGLILTAQSLEDNGDGAKKEGS
ncbi:MAG TPA: hypothetical protein DCP63_15125 [Bacteroidetes bacterium]|nr:hypothetical protein [Bacteroidota bacterium]